MQNFPLQPNMKWLIKSEFKSITLTENNNRHCGCLLNIAVLKAIKLFLFVAVTYDLSLTENMLRMAVFAITREPLISLLLSVGMSAKFTAPKLTIQTGAVGTTQKKTGWF